MSPWSKCWLWWKLAFFYGFLLFLCRHAFKIHSNVFDKGIDSETKVTTLDAKKLIFENWQSFVFSLHRISSISPWSLTMLTQMRNWQRLRKTSGTFPPLSEARLLSLKCWRKNIETNKNQTNPSTTFGPAADTGWILDTYIPGDWFAFDFSGFLLSHISQGHNSQCCSLLEK